MAGGDDCERAVPPSCYPLPPRLFRKILILMGLLGGQCRNYDITKELFTDIREQKSYGVFEEVLNFGKSPGIPLLSFY